MARMSELDPVAPAGTRDPRAPAARRRFYGGLFVLTSSTLMLELLQTRLLSVVVWYHLAFFVISAAMFGMTAGAIWVYLRRDRFSAATLPGDLAWLSTGFAASTGISLAVQMSLAPAIVGSAMFAVVFAELALTIAVPFFFAGAATSLALTRSPYPIGRVYAADLAGAALGCLGVLAVLRVTDAPSAILLTGAGAAGAALLFAPPGVPAAPTDRGWGRRALSRPGIVLVLLAMLGVANSVTRHGLQPVVVKGRVEGRRGEVAFERWNSFSRIVAYAPQIRPPSMWGPSPRFVPVPVEQIAMDIDGAAGTTMYRFDGNAASAGFLAYDLTNLVYSVRSSGRASMVGVGGGRDVLSAWAAGFRDVTGVEINPLFVELLNREDRFAGFSGIAGLPGVRLVVDEARSWFTGTRERFDVIEMSLTDTQAATGAGAFTLSENGLYTVEAWTMFLARLAPKGIFSVSRWYAPGIPEETGRMLSLATAALLESGVAEPRQHVFVAACGPLATLLMSREPMDPADVSSLQQTCERLDYEVLVRPGQRPPSDVLESILSATTRQELVRRTSGFDLDLTPPTDDRPFFFNQLPFTRPLSAFRYMRLAGVAAGNFAATITLLTILLVCLVLVAATILVPLSPTLKQVAPDLVVGGTTYFGLLGLGFMFVEIGLLQRIGLFLGHPVYSLSIVLFGLILFAGLGSAWSEQLPLTSRHRFTLWALVTFAYLASIPAWMPSALGTFGSAGIQVRALVSTAMIAPAGLLMGFGFPTGMRLVSGRDDRPTAWFWGINGATGVLASVVAVALSIAFGIGVTIVLGSLCYLALIPCAVSLGFRRAEAAAG